MGDATCKKCKTTYDGYNGNFYVHSKKIDGTVKYRTECKKCVLEKTKKMKKLKKSKEEDNSDSSNDEKNFDEIKEGVSILEFENETNEQIINDDGHIHEIVGSALNDYSKFDKSQKDFMKSQFEKRVDALRTEICDFQKLERMFFIKKIEELQKTNDQYGKIISLLVEKLNIDEDEIENLLDAEDEDED